MILALLNYININMGMYTGGSQITLLNFPAPNMYTPTGMSVDIMMRPTTSINSAGGVFNFNTELVFKSKNPADGYKTASDMLLNMNKVTNKDVGDSLEFQLILINALLSIPTYAGQTDTEEYVYTVEFNILMAENTDTGGY